MSYVLQADYWLIFFLQGNGEWLTPVMKLFTWLGYPQAYMVAIAIIYWSGNRKLGLRMAIFLPVVSSLNSILKQAIHAPRPYWLTPDIRAIHVSNGFGMPSGHAQASIVWLYAAALLKKGWFWIFAVVLVMGVGLSRVYLGMHFSSQVLAGWLLGIFIAFLFMRFESRVLCWFLSLTFRKQLLLISGISLLLMVLGGIMVFVLKHWEMPGDWILNSADDMAGKDESILSSVGMSAVAGNVGGFLGVSLGALLLHRKESFDSRGSGWTRLVRSLTGLFILIVLYKVFMIAAPGQTEAFLYSLWRFLGFFTLSFFVIFLVPLLFLRFRLPGSLKRKQR